MLPFRLYTSISLCLRQKNYRRAMDTSKKGNSKQPFFKIVQRVIAWIMGIFFGMKSYSRLLLVSFITSLAVETTQFIFRIGVADIDDLFLNTIGALTGLLILHTLFPVGSRQYRLTDNWQTADEL